MKSAQLGVRIKQLQSVSYSINKDANGRELVGRYEFMEWATKALHVIALAFGRDGDHYRELRKQVDQFCGLRDEFEAARGVVSAAYDDFEDGLAAGIAEFYQAEVFDDMLEMALHLHESGYHLAAVSITGAVLEDALRKLYAREVGPVPQDSKLSVLNGEDLKKYYGQPTWRQIQTWADIRNDVDHGRYSNSKQQKTLDENGDPYPVIDPRQVRRMIDWTRDFMEKHLT